MPLNPEYQLRPYQKEIVDQMVDVGKVLVAAVMGSGKSYMTIATVEDLIEHDDIDRALIAVPASLKYQWEREIRKFTKGSRVIVIDGPPKKREQQWKSARMAQYIIVNFELIVNDIHWLRDIPVECLVIDEISYLKSPRAKRSRALKRYAKRVPFRYGLTGTPVENRPEELFSIMQAVDPQVLGTADIFDHTFIVRDNYGKPARYRNLDKLQTRLGDHIVRISREDIIDQLPKVVTQHIEVDIDPAGRTLYNELAKELYNEIKLAVRQFGSFDVFAHYGPDRADQAEISGRIMAKMTILRMLCDNPAIITTSGETWLQGAHDAIYSSRFIKPGMEFDLHDPKLWGKLEIDRPKKGSEEAARLLRSGRLEGITKSPKLAACAELIEEILDEDPKNKVVLFSFFVDSLEHVAQATKHVTKSVKFVGSMNAKAREVAKEQFREDPDTRLFLSSDAGGFGVDLPMANYLISLNLPWSAGKLDQREARIIRLSSEFKSVNLISFVIRGSIEQWQFDLLQQKRSIAAAFIDGQHRKGGLELDLASLTECLAFPL